MTDDPDCRLNCVGIDTQIPDIPENVVIDHATSHWWGNKILEIQTCPEGTVCTHVVETCPPPIVCPRSLPYLLEGVGIGFTLGLAFAYLVIRWLLHGRKIR